MTHLVRIGLALGLTLAANSAFSAADLRFPVKPIRFIVPQPPGGGIDLLARTVGQKLAETLGNAMVVENRSGAGGTIGVNLTVEAPPDGYTIVMGFMGPISVSASLTKLPYDPIKDLSPITLVAATPSALVIHPSVPATTVRELIGVVAARPGHYLYGSAGNGSTPHLAGEMFKLATKTDMVHVPYKGSGPALIDLFGGQFSVYFASLPAILPHLPSGKVRALAVTGARRSQLTPALPTVAEAGVPGYSLEQWYGVFAPARTPAVIADQLNAVIIKVLRSAELQARLSADGFDVVGNSRAEFAAYLKEDVARWAKVIKAANIRVD